MSKKDKEKDKKRRKTRVEVKVVRLAHGEGLPLPDYQTEGSAGLDLVAAIGEATPWVLEPLARVAVPTALMLQLPTGMEAQVRPRSGLAWKYGLTILNAPGTIDSDYRGEVQVILVNLSKEAYTIHRGDRIAQLIIAPVVQADLVAVADLTETERGEGGFGSTGTSVKADETSKRKKTKKKKPVPAKAAIGESPSKAAQTRTPRRAS